MSEARRSRNLFFPLAAFCSALFIITILAMLAGVLGDERGPLARLLDEYAGRLIGGEVIAILVTGFLAMYLDRRQTLRVAANDTIGTPPKNAPVLGSNSPPLRQRGPGGVEQT